jgi:hypothetical protein
MVGSMKMLQANNSDNTSVAQEITKAIQSLKFGSIEITVHDGKVTQIEKREKVRFSNQTITNKPTVNNSGNQK